MSPSPLHPLQELDQILFTIEGGRAMGLRVFDSLPLSWFVGHDREEGLASLWASCNDPLVLISLAVRVSSPRDAVHLACECVRLATTRCASLPTAVSSLLDEVEKWGTAEYSADRVAIARSLMVDAASGAWDGPEKSAMDAAGWAAETASDDPVGRARAARRAADEARLSLAAERDWSDRRAWQESYGRADIELSESIRRFAPAPRPEALLAYVEQIKARRARAR